MSKIQRNKKFPVALKIVGMFLSDGYQNCKLFARKLRKHHKEYFREPVVKGFLEVDWIEYLGTLQRTVGGQTWAIRKGVVVFIDDLFIGGEESLFSYYRLTYEHKKPSVEAIKGLAKQEYLEYLNKKNLLYTYMEFSLDKSYIGTLLFELQVDLLPQTCSRFALLCNTDNDAGLSYKGSSVFRICKGGWFQAGRLTQTIATLEEESFCYPHNRRGVISLTNQDKHTTTNEFFVTFTTSRWMDRRYVAFGRVVEGWELLRRIENVSCKYESPVGNITISDCGLAAAGFGRKMVTKFKVKGITIGEPHIDCETFVDLLLDCFAASLFDRLNREVKKQLNAEWMATMIWEKIEPFLRTRQPVQDFPDFRDVPSKEHLYDRHLVGLDGLFDVPDHYIRLLVEKIVNDCLDQNEVINIAKSIVTFILNSLDFKSESELAAQSFITKLISHINLIIYSPEEETPNETSVRTNLNKILSGILSKSFSSTMRVPDLTGEIGTMEGKHIEDTLSEGGVSAQKSLAGYLRSMLFNEMKISGH